MPTNKPLRRTGRERRPFFFDDPALERLLGMVVTLGGEVWALRERLAAIEGIGIRQGSLSSAELDDYEFTLDQQLRLAAERKEFIDSLFRALQERESAARGGKAIRRAARVPAARARKRPSPRPRR